MPVEIGLGERTGRISELLFILMIFTSTEAYQHTAYYREGNCQSYFHPKKRSIDVQTVQTNDKEYSLSDAKVPKTLFMSSLLFTFVPNISNMLKFICLGSGSSGNCYCLFTENDGLMIDAGIGIRLLKRSFKEYGLSLSQIHHILVTHDHADHVKSVGAISLDYHLPVYATHLVHAGIERNYCVHKKVAPAYMEVIDLSLIHI